MDHHSNPGVTHRSPVRISPGTLAREPFRLFFPAAVLAGLTGVMLWPLHFAGMVAAYPGAGHARLMAFGFFGGFIFGFLGTAMPRMLSAPPLHLAETASLLALQVGLILSFATGRLGWGIVMQLALFAGFFMVVATRFRARTDNPPPAFLLVALGLICGMAGSILFLLSEFGMQLPQFWLNLVRPLSYQGFILLPILGVGGFILPRFFGMPSRQDFPESLRPSREWTAKAWLALGAGLLIIISFFLEAGGWFALGYSLRALTALVFLAFDVPFHYAFRRQGALAVCLLGAFIFMLVGFAAVALFPAYRVAWLHLALMGGFAVITFTVATRVVWGHSGHQRLLAASNRWVYGTMGLMILGMATRISGDYWPVVMGSHYSYGAILWGIGVLVWAWKVLPKVLLADDD